MINNTMINNTRHATNLDCFLAYDFENPKSPSLALVSSTSHSSSKKLELGCSSKEHNHVVVVKSLKKIVEFVQQQQQDWHDSLAPNKERQALFETQCARLKRKTIRHNSGFFNKTINYEAFIYRINLVFTLNFPANVSIEQVKDNQIVYSISIDCLTTYGEINECLNKIKEKKINVSVKCGHSNEKTACGYVDHVFQTTYRKCFKTLGLPIEFKERSNVFLKEGNQSEKIQINFSEWEKTFFREKIEERHVFLRSKGYSKERIKEADLSDLAGKA